jgi:uncharacterized protein (TIGR03067 family)
MIRLALCSLFVFAVPVMADEKSDAELKALVGTWDITKAEMGGEDITEVLKVLKFEIMAGGKYIAEHDKQKDEGAFTLDLSKTPKQMDIKGNGGPNKDKLIKAIYKRDGDDLTVCYDFSGGDRPAKFETKPKTMQLLITYKRKK